MKHVSIYYLSTTTTITKYVLNYFSKYHIVTQGIFNHRNVLIKIHHGVGIGLG